MPLTIHQEEKLEEALDLLESNRAVLIKGNAGTGKTYLLDELISRVSVGMQSYKKIYGSAPTNKAVGILTGKINTKVKNLELITTHKAMKISAFIDNKTGKKSFIPMFSDKNPPLKGVKYLIVDESSMMDIRMHIHIIEHATRQNCKIIFLGDDKQINPVGEIDSTVFLGKPIKFDTKEDVITWNDIHDIETEPIQVDDKWICFEPYPEIELTEIIRQGEGNPIITLSRNLSAIWELETRMIEDKGFCYTFDENKVIEELAKVNGTDTLKYLAWTNDAVDRINKAVRERIYIDPRKIEVGESLIFDSPYEEYYTSQELRVDTLDIDTITFNVITQENPTVEITKVPLKCYIINGKKVDTWGDNKPTWQGVFVIHEDSEAHLDILSKVLLTSAKKRQIKFTTRESFIIKFAQVKYNHAITIHKS